jgi:hypothetical protein
MTYYERQFWYRTEKRVGEMAGEALAAQSLTQQTDQELAWCVGLLRAWEQIKELLASGRVLQFDEPGKLLR